MTRPVVAKKVTIDLQDNILLIDGEPFPYAVQPGLDVMDLGNPAALPYVNLALYAETFEVIPKGGRPAPEPKPTDPAKPEPQPEPPTKPEPEVPTGPRPKPAEVLNIGPKPGQNHFKLQLAEMGAKDIEEISVADLAAGYENIPLFYNTGDGVEFSAQLGAPHTSGTKYSRCELREMTAAGEKMGFDVLVGSHYLAGESQIVAQPTKKPDIVVAQLHNGDADRVAIRTQLFSTGELRLVVRVNGAVQKGSADVLGVPYELGRRFRWEILTLPDGSVKVWIDGKLVVDAPEGVLESTGSPSWYFKAGCYNQSTDNPLQVGAVRLKDLRCSHRA